MRTIVLWIWNDQKKRVEEMEMVDCEGLTAGEVKELISYAITDIKENMKAIV